VNYSCKVSPASVAVTSSTETSSFQPWWTSADITIFGLAAQPKEVRLGDHAIQAWHYDGSAHSVTVNVPEAAKNWTIQVTL
jgi:alpha-glucosidase